MHAHKTRFPLALTVLVTAAMLSGAAVADTPRIMLVGDSWAWFLYLSDGLDKALDEAGLGDYGHVGMYTSVPGSTAKQWTNSKWLANITKAYERNPTIDIIHLSLGGNGFLRQWRPEMSDGARDKLFRSIVADIDVVVNHCLHLSPDMRVAIVNYDYVNAKRGNGTVAQLNQAGMILAGMKRELARKYDRVEYIQNYGLMQYHFGYAPHFGPKEVAYPGQAPHFDPWPGGHKDFGSPKQAMMDKIHLSPEGYHVLARHCVDTLYAHWLQEGPDKSTGKVASHAKAEEFGGDR